MPVILRLLAAGVPAAKIIAKYGKKAYDAAKKAHKAIKKMPTRNKVANLIAAGAWLAPLGAIVVSKHIKEKRKEKKKKIRMETRKAQRGIKTYSKGSIVRKPRSY